MEKIAILAKIITEETERFKGEETNADAMRTAAFYAWEEHGATSSDFGDAAVSLGLHRQGSMNRYNEMLRNWENA
jgi:hypothetical protein